MCVTQNIFYECGCLEDTKYTMCDRAVTETCHSTQMAPPVVKSHPCAACFARGLADKARKTREAKDKKARESGGAGPSRS